MMAALRNCRPVDEVLPPGRMSVLGFQHVLAMYAGAVAVPLILGSTLSLTKQQVAMLINADLFTCGIATLLQTLGLTRFIGIRLPVLLGVSFASLSTMITVGKTLGMPYVYGSILVSGLFVLLFAKFLSRLRPLFPPLVVGTVLVIIGASLMQVGFRWAAGGADSPDFGAPVHFITAISVLLVIILITRFGKGFFTSIAVLTAMIGGTACWFFMGRISLAGIDAEPWVAFIRPFWFGMPRFDLIAIANMILVACVNVVESMGVFISAGSICDVPVEEKEIAAGLRSEGLAVILGSCLNSFPYVTFGQNLGLLSLTRVKSRFVVALAGAFLVILGLFPKIGFLVASIPEAVLGGAALVMFGMVIAAGLNILKEVDFSALENQFTAAVAFGVGLGVSLTPQAFSRLPEALQLIFSNGIVVGTLTAVLLCCLFSGKKEKPGTAP
ncbi:MAG: nucleobase:cation symporter-2 family protein [Candidatus Eremiobacteraeota bacterium]|nr:nucleobase:cation symporter-2 family protein [Candidatus Eremiobacteraeota bacterium]